MTYVLDTHVLAWFFSDSPRLSSAARSILESHHARLAVPSVVCAELFDMQRRGRLRVDVASALKRLAQVEGVVFLPFSVTALQYLPLALDVHDAMIVATTLAYEKESGDAVRLISADGDIRACGLVETVW